MQLSLDQKIQAAVSPLLERIAAIEAQNKQLKKEIVLLQGQPQHKNINKMINKTASEHVERPKNIKRQYQHPQPKHQPRVIHKSGQKKEEHKLQSDEGKTQGSKVIGTKTPILSNKAIASSAIHKESNEPKNLKSKPLTHPVSKPLNAEMPKVAPSDKKQPQHKNNDGQTQKKQGEQEKKYASKQREHKINSTHGVKSPVINKSKPIQSQPINKKITAQTKAETKPLKGVKPKTPFQMKPEKHQKEELGPKVQEPQLYTPEQEAQVIAKDKGQVAEHAYLQLQHLQKPEQKKQEMQENLKKSQQKEETGGKMQAKPQSGLVGIQQQTS